MASLRCHGDSDCNKTDIIRNFHLYIIQLWKPFFHIFNHGDVVDAQTWEVSPQKNPVEPPQSTLSSIPLLHPSVHLVHDYPIKMDAVLSRVPVREHLISSIC